MAVRLRHVVKDRGDVLLGLHQRDTRALSAFGLRFKRNHVLKLLGDDEVANLDRHDGDAPVRHLLLDGFAKLLVKLMTAHDHVLERRAADGVAQGRLRGKRHGEVAILHFSAGLFGVPDNPEQHGVHVERYKVAGQRLLSAERRGIHALIDAQRAEFEQRDGEEQPRARKAVEPAEAHDHDAFPVHAHMYRRQDGEAHNHGDDDPRERELAERENERRKHNRERDKSEHHRDHHRAVSRGFLRRVGAICVRRNAELHFGAAIRVLLPLRVGLILELSHDPFSSSSRTKTPSSECHHMPCRFRGILSRTLRQARPPPAQVLR